MVSPDIPVLACSHHKLLCCINVHVIQGSLPHQVSVQHKLEVWCLSTYNNTQIGSVTFINIQGTETGSVTSINIQRTQTGSVVCVNVQQYTDWKCDVYQHTRDTDWKCDVYQRIKDTDWKCGVCQLTTIHRLEV